MKEFKYFNPKNCFEALGKIIRVVHPGSGFFYPTRIPDPGVKKAPDLGTRIRNPVLTSMNFTDSCPSLFRGPAAAVTSPARPHKPKTVPAERLLLLPLSSLQDNGGDSVRGDRCTTPPTPG